MGGILKEIRAFGGDGRAEESIISSLSLYDGEVEVCTVSAYGMV
jgi:hypothetical protein